MILVHFDHLTAYILLKQSIYITMPVFVAWNIVCIYLKAYAWFVKCFAGFHRQALAPAPTP